MLDIYLKKTFVSPDSKHVHRQIWHIVSRDPLSRSFSYFSRRTFAHTTTHKVPGGS